MVPTSSGTRMEQQIVIDSVKEKRERKTTVHLCRPSSSPLALPNDIRGETMHRRTYRPACTYLSVCARDRHEDEKSSSFVGDKQQHESSRKAPPRARLKRVRTPQAQSNRTGNALPIQYQERRPICLTEGGGPTGHAHARTLKLPQQGTRKSSGKAETTCRYG